MFSPKCVRKVPLSFIRSTIRFARDDPFISFDSSLTLSRQIFFFSLYRSVCQIVSCARQIA